MKRTSALFIPIYYFKNAWYAYLLILGLNGIISYPPLNASTLPHALILILYLGCTKITNADNNVYLEGSIQ